MFYILVQKHNKYIKRVSKGFASMSLVSMCVYKRPSHDMFLIKRCAAALSADQKNHRYECMCGGRWRGGQHREYDR